MARITKYSGAEMTGVWNGVIFTGLGPDTAYSVEQAEDAFTQQIGIDGESVRVRNKNDSGSITVTLMRSSSSNQFLSAFHLADRATGAGVGPFLLQDQNGTHIFEASRCWIRKFPNVEFGREGGTVEWIFDTNELIEFIGANQEL